MKVMSRRALTPRLLATSVFVAAAAQIAVPGHAQPRNSDLTVGPQADGSIVVSSGQTITPAGAQTLLGAGVAPTAVALNPNPTSNTAAVLTLRAGVWVVNTVTGAIVQAEFPSASGSYNGVAYSADGTKLFFSQDDNHFGIATVDPATGKLTLASSLALPTVAADHPTPPLPYANATDIIPGGIALSADGSHAYVVLEAANTLGVINLTGTPALQAEIAVGNVPNSVVISADGHYAYVSNQGGRLAASGEYTNASDGAAVVADPNDAFSTTGTVSVVDLTTNTVAATIDVGLQPVGMTISGGHLYVANSSSDTVSVIDLNTNKVVRTIDVGVPLPGNGPAGSAAVGGTDAHNDGNVAEAAASLRAFGSGPVAVTVVDDRTAYVTLGTSNAIAVIDLSNRFGNPVAGYIPTGYVPTDVTYDAVNKQLLVTASRGVGAQVSQFTIGDTTSISAPNGAAPQETGFAGSTSGGTVNAIPLPTGKLLAHYTEQVLNDNNWGALNPNTFVGPEFVDRDARPVPVPKHLGEPSTIKHVFLIIKENRTYDTILGDLPQANGDPSLAALAGATPNQHALIKRFPLLDNTYAPGTPSSEGHPWITMSAGMYYTSSMWDDESTRGAHWTYDDALLYTPRGSLWSAAQKKGLSVKLYGETVSSAVVQPNPATGGAFTWGDYYNTALCIEGKIAAATCATLAQVPFNTWTSASKIPSAENIIDPQFPELDLTVPDQYRVDYYLSVFQQQLATNTVPNLVIMQLPDDHTSGGALGVPLPADQVADNDLALGRLVEAISQSKIWESSAIFVEEDDSGNDVDHVDGHRMTAYAISPWTAPPQAANEGKVVHTRYTQQDISRTIEQILGFEPLTQYDLVASPMFDVFGDRPDLTPWTHIPATFPLNQQFDGTFLGWSGLGANFGKLELSPLQKAWNQASNGLKAKLTKADAADPDFVRHALWYSATDWKRPFPGDTEIKWPDEFVKAAALKVRDDDDDDDDQQPVKTMTDAGKH